MTASLSVLNPTLYRRLERHFGEVRVRNPGQKWVATCQRDVCGEPRWVVKQWGEEYMLCCPICREKRHQLAISYMYGQRDPDSGRLLTYAAHCHAHNCTSSAQNRTGLAEMLCVNDGILENARIGQGKVVSEVERIPRLPSPRIPVHELPKGHMAQRVLAYQGFQPHKVSRMYDLYFCPGSKDPLIRDRIIIPIVMRGEYRGWQSLSLVARSSSPDEDPPPRYLSGPGMKTSSLIYNLDRARQYQACVIVPEPTEVWAFGGMAVCPLGSSLSKAQLRILKSVFRKHPKVLLVRDSERSLPAVQHLRNTLERHMLGSLVVVEFENKEVPDRKRRSFLRNLVSEKCRASSLRISFKKGT